MTKKPGHSYTSMKTYDICPLQYWHRRINKTYEEKHSPQILEGWRVHEAFEKALKDGKPLPPDLTKYAPLLETFEQPYFVEMQLAVDKDFHACKYFDDRARFRAVLDVVRIDGDSAKIIDWKTGKVREDPMQLQGNAAILMEHFPTVKRVSACFIWLKYNKMTLVHTDQKERDKIRQNLLERMMEIEDDNEYVPTPSYMCRWCPAYADCEYAQR